MDTSGVQKTLNNLWASTVEDYDFDILNHTIRFMTKVIHSGVVSEYDVEFSKVASYYFIGGLDDERHNCLEPDEGDYVDLTSVHFSHDGIGDIKIIPHREWRNNYPSTPNFAIEMWNKMLFIEAAEVKVNDVHLNVGYPVKA